MMASELITLLQTIVDKRGDGRVVISVLDSNEGSTLPYSSSVDVKACIAGFNAYEEERGRLFLLPSDSLITMNAALRAIRGKNRSDE